MDISETDDLLRTAARCALETTDFAVALENYRRMLPTVAPGLLAAIPPGEEAQRAVAFAMLREVWNRLPRPDNDWRPQPLPKPERNASCPCGSGRKYKQCCGLSGRPSFGEGLSVLGYVLEGMLPSRYRDLPFKKLSPEELAHVAEQWLDDGRHEEAAALLEPLLADIARLDARHEYAFDVLGDAYLELGRPQSRVDLVERMMQAPDRDLKGAALHRRTTMCADAGDYAAAWKLFKEAQRVDPDNPGLSHLEVVLLVSQGEVDQAQERARFWAARLKRLGYEGERIVEMMEEIAADPRDFVRAFRRGQFGGDDAEIPADIARLADLVGKLPAPACHYCLKPQDGDAGALEASAQLRELEAAWEDVFFGDAEEMDDAWEDTGWVDWLAGHPLAWQSFDVLENIAMALEDAPSDDEDTDELLVRIEDILFAHAVALLRANLAANGAEGCRLEWGWLENRAALTLLADASQMAAGFDEELPLLEWLVLTLNPNDNQGMRERLALVYLAQGRAADALALCDKYPDDGLNAMGYARVLALYLLERRGEAVAALAAMKRQAPRILRTLTAAKPRMPELHQGYRSVGGEDEAWYYRQDWCGIWEESGALDWLKRNAGKS